MNDARLATIRALLAKAEATDFPDEAEAFTAKAAELMSRYAIDEATVWAADRTSGTPEHRSITLHRPYLIQKSVLVHEISSIFGCQSIRMMEGVSAPTEQVAIIGFSSDLDLVEAMVTSLMVQAATAMVVDQPTGLSSSSAAAFRRSHLMGFIDTAASRLRDRHQATIDERERAAGPGPGATSGAGAGPRSGSVPVPASMSLVLADRADAVSEEFRRRFPHVRHARVSVGSSRDGRVAGQAAGRRADLGSPGLRRARAIGA